MAKPNAIPTREPIGVEQSHQGKKPLQNTFEAFPADFVADPIASKETKRSSSAQTKFEGWCQAGLSDFELEDALRDYGKRLHSRAFWDLVRRITPWTR